MPIERVSGTDLSYYLIAFDAQSRERTDDPDGLLSQHVLTAVAQEPVTDVFLISHGWMGDVPAARQQYNNWIGAMAACQEDLARLRDVRPAFHPLLIGLHWPSLPWGDEEIQPGGISFGDPTADPVADLVEQYAARLADTEAAREALYTIIGAAASDPNPVALPPEVADAYQRLYTQAGLASQGLEAAPGADHDAFDPEGIMQEAAEAETDSAVSFSLPSLGDLLAPLRVLSYWKMKARACDFGTSTGATLLGALQQAAPAARQVRFHLMGHSFGGVVVSAILHGANTSGKLVQPVDSLLLAQGALSLWSYCTDIPARRGTPGYFRSIIAKQCVAGPIVTTQSQYDRALSFSYPLGSRVGGHIDFATPGALPTYGAVGIYGLQGPGMTAIDSTILPVQSRYGFTGGTIYNLESSTVIREGSGSSGAHNDIARSEVAHAFWEAIAG